MGSLAYALELLTQVPALLAAGVQVTGLIKQGVSALEAMQADKRDPSPEEWNALNAQIAALRAELHA